MTAAAPEQTFPTPQRERGYTSEQTAGTWWTSVSTEQTPELRWPQSVEIFEAMPTQDAQVSSVLRAVVTPITRTGWRVDGRGCREEVVRHVATDLGLPIVGEGNEVPAVRTRGRFSWQDHLNLALRTKLRFGHAVFEQIYRIDPDTGLAHLRKLGYRPPRTISKFNVARDGGLQSIEQRGTGPVSTGPYTTTGSTGTITLPVSRLVVYVNDRDGGEWWGRSLLRPAYKYWILKDRALRIQSQVAERNGMGIPAYKGAPGESDLTAGRDIAAAVRAGDNAGLALPDGADLELKGVTGQLPNILEHIQYYDEQIARAVLAHFLNLGSQTGSWALGSTFADFFTLSLQAVAEEIRDTGTQHVVEDLVDINWGANEPAPRLVFDEIGSRGDAIVLAVSQLVTAGVLKPDPELEKFIRTTLNLPPREET